MRCLFSDSRVLGFQMIAQLSNFSEVQRLYVNKTTDRQTPVSVLVEESGLYQVTVFAIRGRRGIVGSNVEFTAELAVSNVPTETTHTDIVIGMSVQYSLNNYMDMLLKKQCRL